MHTLTLKIQDNVLDKIIYFLSNLPKDEVEIIEDKLETEHKKSENQLVKAFSNAQVDMSNFKFDRNEANER